jgi:hypothetical protein
MAKLLANGNYLNHGCATCQKGVTLDAIEKANDLKTVDNKKTLLLYIIETYEDSIIVKEENL